MIEVWCSVVGYEGYYEVSNWGRVRSLPRKTRRGMRGGRVLKSHTNKNGYLMLSLSKNGKANIYYIHRLVAEAFIDNPYNLPCINHRDENKANNFVFVKEDGSVDSQKSNLEWITLEDNFQYGTARERAAKAKRGVYNTKSSKTIYQFTLDGELVREWVSTAEVYRQTGWCRGNISKCCNGKRPTAHGYRWSYSTVVPSSKSISNCLKSTS